MSSHTLLSDHCNSVPRSASVIHSEPLLNILVARSRSKFLTLRPFKPQTVAEAAVARIPGSKHRVGTLDRVRYWEQWRGTINIKQPWKIIRTRFYVFFENPKNMTFYVFLSCCTRFLEHWPSVGGCGRLSQSSWLLGALQYGYTYLVAYLHTK